MSKAQFGAANPSWKGNAAKDQSGRGRAERMYPQLEPCETCGASTPTRIERHHRDSNRLNNTRANIAFLCKPHHTDAHRLTDGQVGGGPRPRIVAIMRQRAIEKAQRIARLRQAGLRDDDIARIVGVHRKSVDRYVRKYPDYFGDGET